MIPGTMQPRQAFFAGLVLAMAAAGCSYNPGYFPYYIPGGRIVEMHAKPGGHGYFKNFDPKAIRIELNPPQTTSPPGSAVVLVATVYDKEGQPRRGRRVEWIVEGPGNIIEVDESGLYAGRGYKVDNKYAVSHTNYTSHVVTRGNDDPRDDVDIAPGQTFCVLTSAVPGETTVTAMAPGVFNWDSGRVVSKIAWADGSFGFPQPVVARFGGETILSTKITAGIKDAETAGYRVRYKVLDGAPAVLITRSGSGTGTSMSGTSAKETEAFADANGEAAVRLAQPTPQAGKTRVAVEIVKPSETGVGPGTVVSRRETTVEWAAPDVELNINAPRAAGLNSVVPITVSLTNLGQVAGAGGTVRVNLPADVQVLRVDPPAGSTAGALAWSFADLSAGGRQEYTLQVRPGRVGSFNVTASVQTSDGMKGEKQATTTVDRAALRALIETPPRALAGDEAKLRLAVTNPGAAPATNITAWVKYDEGLKHASGQNPVEVNVGEVAAGQTRTIDIPFTTGPSGRYVVRANLTADGGLNANVDPASVEVRRAELKLAVTGPARVYVGQEITWDLTLRNPGDTPIANVVLRGTLPADVKGPTASENGRITGPTVEWQLGEIKPGDERKLKLSAEAANLANAATLSVIAMGDPISVSGAKPAGDPIEAKAEATVALIGSPALVLEHTAPQGPIEVGKRTSLTVRVKNRGTVSARGVQVNVFIPPEFKAIRGSGPNEGRLETDQVVYPALEEVSPGATATFTVELEATASGSARVRAEVRALHLANPLKEEQAVSVVGSR